jgi:hypothetical protein
MGFRTALSRKFPQIQSIPKRCVSGLSSRPDGAGKLILLIGEQYGCRSYGKYGHYRKQRKCLHYFSLDLSLSELGQIDQIFNVVCKEIKAGNKLRCHRAVIGRSNRRHLFVSCFQRFVTL